MFLISIFVRFPHYDKLRSFFKIMAERSETAPLPHDGDSSDEGSIPSTLYARCSGTVSRSLNARRLRQAAENDVVFLQNRLSKLKHEEEKAKREIRRLKDKTQEVSVGRSRHSESTSMRRELQDQVDYGKRKEAALIALNKERQAKAVLSSKQKILMTRRDSVQNMRKQKEINECRIHILKEEQREKNTRQRETIKQLHEAAKARREKEMETKRDEVRDILESKIEQEQQERLKKEKLSAELVAQEAQMIYRLKRLHQEKQDALRSLAFAVDPEHSQAHSSITESSEQKDH